MSPDAYNGKILSALEQIQRDVADIKAKMASAPVAGGGGEVASDSDLDGKYGDPTIKYDPKPKYWSGESFVGFKFSETTPEYLEATAKYLDACAFMAAKDAAAGKDIEKNEKSAKYKAIDANRARGWAARLRNGHQPAPPANDGGGYGAGATGTDDIPFAYIETRWDRP